MKKIYFILIFIFCQNSVFCQIKNVISFEMLSNWFSIDNQTDSLISDRTEKYIFYTNFLLNNRKDTVFINKNEQKSEINPKKQFTNRLTVKVLNNKAYLLIWNKTDTDTISLQFHPKKRMIQVNDDFYFLTNKYYKFLTKKILKEKNICEIADFLDDNLGDYFLPEELFLISSKSKYKKKFRIKNATTKTIKVDSDGFDSWEISFLYDEKGILEIQKKGINDGFPYTKTRKYIDFEKIIFEIEENTAKRNTTKQQEIFFSNQQQKIEQKNVQYGLNITSFLKNEAKRKN